MTQENDALVERLAIRRRAGHGSPLSCESRLAIDSAFQRFVTCSFTRLPWLDDGDRSTQDRVMKDDRKRVPIDDPYTFALGLAAYCFATCEWNAVWSAERLQPGYVDTIERKRKTAGMIAQELVGLVDAISNPLLKAICAPPAAEFQRLVRERNDLLHGKPGTAPSGDQRLFCGGREWTITAVDDFSDRVTVCSLLLNEMVHKHLVTP